MAFIFSDTEKWKKQFFKDFSAHEKLWWCYIWDQSDRVGVWYEDYEVGSIYTGVKIDKNSFVNSFLPLLIPLSKKRWYIRGYLRDQYGAELSFKSNMHLGVTKTLRQHQIVDFEGIAMALNGTSTGWPNRLFEESMEKSESQQAEIALPSQFKDWSEYLNHLATANTDPKKSNKEKDAA